MLIFLHETFLQDDQLLPREQFFARWSKCIQPKFQQTTVRREVRNLKGRKNRSSPSEILRFERHSFCNRQCWHPCGYVARVRHSVCRDRKLRTSSESTISVAESRRCVQCLCLATGCQFSPRQTGPSSGTRTVQVVVRLLPSSASGISKGTSCGVGAMDLSPRTTSGAPLREYRSSWLLHCPSTGGGSCRRAGEDFLATW